MERIKPKVFIISMFKAEAEIWHSRPELLNLTSRRIEVPGLHRDYPYINCTENGEVCQVITGEGLINAALTISALLFSPIFDLTKTYFLIAGVAGINPRHGTLGSVVIPRFSVQVDLQYEFDAREIPSDWPTGYVPQGADHPLGKAKHIYGTEVYELNDNLRQLAKGFAEEAALSDSEAAKAFRRRYEGSEGGMFNAATLPPSILTGDVLSANTFFHGHLLTEAFSHTCTTLTHGLGTYVVTAQEDNGTLAALHRGSLMGKCDFGRVMVVRSGCNFDRPPPGEGPRMPLHSSHGGFEIAVGNLGRAGVEVVWGVLGGWEGIFEGGVEAGNYIGDVKGWGMVVLGVWGGI